MRNELLLLQGELQRRGVWGKVNLGINGEGRAAKGAQLDMGVGQWGCLGQNQH